SAGARYGPRPFLGHAGNGTRAIRDGEARKLPRLSRTERHAQPVVGTMIVDALFRRLFPVTVGVLLAIAAYFQATGLSAIIETRLLMPASSKPVRIAPPAGPAAIDLGDSVHATSARAILARNPFDSKTGPLQASDNPRESAGETPGPN